MQTTSPLPADAETTSKRHDNQKETIHHPRYAVTAIPRR